MDFELIKLSVVEDMGLKEGIRCHYRLPLGFLSRIYRCLRRKHENKLDHCLKKLTSYLVLTFKLLPLSAEEIFVACSEAQFICRGINKMFASKSHLKMTRSEEKKGMRRTLTIENNYPSEEAKPSLFSKQRKSRKQTSTKASETKLDSKKKVLQAESRLQEYTEMALKLISSHINGRKELNKMLRSYFPEVFLRR
jgi:hypothetical protein